MTKHNLEKLDKGQLEFMWNFMRFKCGQQSNIPALKKHLDMLRQLMTQKTGGQAQYKKLMMCRLRISEQSLTVLS